MPPGSQGLLPPGSQGSLGQLRTEYDDKEKYTTMLLNECASFQLKLDAVEKEAARLHGMKNAGVE